MGVERKETGTKHLLSVSAILGHPWKDLEAVLLGRRPARVMIQLTRIVGYYSRVDNWNPSKIAELDDRHRGDYALAEKTRDLDGVTPDIVVEALAAGGAEMACEVAA